MTGMILGFADWGNARRRSLSYRLSIIGLVLSAATLVLAIVIGFLGLQTITFGSR